MMPARLRIGFPACASFDLLPGASGQSGTPEPFVTVYEAASIGDLYGVPYQGLRANRDARDKAFHARFLRPARFTLSWVGPELVNGPASRGYAHVAVFDRFALPTARVQDFNMWFVTEYLPSMEAVPGVRRVRRYFAMEGEPSHVVVHELEDETVLRSPAWTSGRNGMRSALASARQSTSASYVRILGLPA